jgi:fructose-1,6-bisphosphatase/inositol monophosphatase family enzyme
MRHFRKTSPERKPDRTFVTEADTAIEQRLRDRIAVAFPQHGVVGEEYGTQEAKDKAGTRWYIDPIDGTHNYMRGVPIFGTLLAVERGAGIYNVAEETPYASSRKARAELGWDPGFRVSPSSR